MNNGYPQRHNTPSIITILDDQAPINLDRAVSENIGILVYDGSLAPLIKRGEPYPCTKSYTFSTYADNQKAIELRFYRGNHSNPAENTFLGKMEMKGFRLMPARQPIVRLYLRACENRIEAWAVDEVDGYRININLEKGEYMPPSDPDQRLKNARFALENFALVNYGPQVVEVPTNLFTETAKDLPRRLRWSVEIEELNISTVNGESQNRSVRGAVLDLLTSPSLLVQVTLRGMDEYFLQLLAERVEFSTPDSLNYRVIATKVVKDDSIYSIERSLMDALVHGALPRSLS